jgi:hypothetical protein
MASTRLETPSRREGGASSSGHAATITRPDISAAAHQVFWLLRIGFTVAPILFGVDKFFN